MHEAAPFEHDATIGNATVTLNSDGLWATCYICDKLIRDGDYQALLEYSVAPFLQKYPAFIPFQADVYRAIGELHQRFKSVATGITTPYP
jgi:hypothetical protein